MTFLEPWFEVTSPDNAPDELKRETSPGHPLTLSMASQLEPLHVDRIATMSCLSFSMVLAGMRWFTFPSRRRRTLNGQNVISSLASRIGSRMA